MAGLNFKSNNVLSDNTSFLTFNLVNRVTSEGDYEIKIKQTLCN